MLLRSSGEQAAADPFNFSGHMDTVPAYDMEGAFDGRISDGKVFGRGACDMKAPSQP